MRKAVRAIIIRDNKLLVMKRNKFGKEYFTLVGGGVDFDESNEQALVREIAEETGLTLKKARLVFTEEAGLPYGTQYVFLCEDPGGEVALHAESEEAKISSMGENIYDPMWLDLDQLPKSEFRSEALKQAILAGVKDGFPDDIVEL